MPKSRSIRHPAPTTDARTPEVRLEAFVREKYLDRAERMMARILDALDEKPEPAPWIAAARTLSERLIISEDAFYWFAEAFTECLVYHGSVNDPELVRIRQEIEAIQRAHGLADDEEFIVDAAPEEWRALTDQWNARADAIVHGVLRATGNADIAEVREKEFAKYRRRVEKGGAEIWKRGDIDDDPID